MDDAKNLRTIANWMDEPDFKLPHHCPMSVDIVQGHLRGIANRIELRCMNLKVILAKVRNILDI